MSMTHSCRLLSLPPSLASPAGHHKEAYELCVQQVHSSTCVQQARIAGQADLVLLHVLQGGTRRPVSCVLMLASPGGACPSQVLGPGAHCLSVTQLLRPLQH
jgi:hypothetical protein